MNKLHVPWWLILLAELIVLLAKRVPKKDV